MSTILLPALRSERVNLYRHETAGMVSGGSGTHSLGSGFAYGSSGGGYGSVGNDLVRIQLHKVGIKPGDRVSARAEVFYDAGSGNDVWLSIRYRGRDGSGLLNVTGPPIATPVDFTETAVANSVVPEGAAEIILTASTNSGTGTLLIRRAAVYRGPVAMPYDIPKRGAYAPMTHAFLERENRQSLINYYAGASQLTSLPSRQWQLSFDTVVLEGDELREWSMALHELSDQGNVFRFTPPEYQGPSTGYQGANPVVSGASQLGTTLTCSGVDPETEILGPGDFLSFDVTTPRGNTNVELNRVRSLATSDEEGNVTFELARPIRLAPADGATVQIFAPTGQFRLRNPRGGIDLGLMRRATVSIDAIEAIFL